MKRETERRLKALEVYRELHDGRPDAIFIGAPGEPPQAALVLSGDRYRHLQRVDGESAESFTLRAEGAAQ